jgi:hypothetical protein
MSDTTHHSTSKRVLVGVIAVLVVAAAVLLSAAVFGGSAEAVELPPVAQQMGVFAGPPVPDTELPPVVRAAQANHNRRGPGVIIPGQTRRLADGLGINRVGIYALPTTGGHVCFVVSEGTYAATCVDSLERDLGNVQWVNYSGETMPQTIAGIASDSARDVKVIVTGEAQKATLSRNSFFWQGEAGVKREDITALLVRQVNGDVVTVDISR